MGMFDSMNQAPSMGNGGSFAQKMKPPTPSGNGTMQSVDSLNMQPKSMRPNPMTGARPALSGAQPMGMRGPRPKPVMPTQGLAPTQLPLNPTPNYNPEAQSNIPSPGTVPSQGVTSLYGQTPGNDTASGIMNAYQSQKQQEPQDGSQATIFGGRELQAPPFQGGGNPSFQDMMQSTEMARPDVMPRGLGPSGYPPGTIMDENGLEPRRGPR